MITIGDMSFERARLPLGVFETNTGQVDGLPANPRKWSKKEVERLAKSIRETPELLELRPVIALRHGDALVVLGGNLRLEAARHLKLDSVPVLIVEDTVPADKLKEIVIKDNGSFGEWDADLLAKDWGGLDLKGWGVPEWETSEPDDSEVAENDDFDPDEVVGESRCVLGDLWQLGEHRLICGDSTDVAVLEKLMGGAEADLLLTDPPYNVGYEGKTKDRMTIANDKMENGSFLNFLRTAFSAAATVLKAGGAYYIWHASIETANFQMAANEALGDVRSILVWVKNVAVLSRQDYHWRHELCLYGWKPGAAHYFIDRHDRTTVIPEREVLESYTKVQLFELLEALSGQVETTVLEEKKPLRNGDHPTMKPVPLFGRQIANSTRRGETVLDPFGGSGTTVVACEQLGRKARIVELDPHYCDVIIARWEKLTGKEAVRL